MSDTSLADLERIYDALAQAIDRAGPAKSELLLVKVALLLGQDMNDRARFEHLLESALQDL